MMNHTMPKRKREATDSNAAEVGGEHAVMSTELRHVAPAHFVLKIKSFSLFAKNNMENYESGKFEAGGYEWKLILYLNGDKSQNGEDHVSLYLAASGTSPFQLGGEIHAAVRFCVYDQTRDVYFEQGRVARFHAMKTEWGFPRYMPLKTFINPSNGYLVGDTCVFGVEVFVIESSGVGECLTLKASASYTHEWKISRLSSLGVESFSDVFTFEDHKWKLWLFPKGNLANRGQSLSVFLVLVDADKHASEQKVNTRFTIRLKDRNNVVCGWQTSTTIWLSSSRTSWGWSTFMPLKTVQERLKDDSCVIEVEVSVLSAVSKLP
ncbi:hypothetical protein BT93_L1568 [Corymbia citriodora subsp. variegata]|uniref:MATH domain-containing protein n=1 Tax=Corymbia citriodora subsp. variegata TaxID=360336 RepID=A0A8T0CS86_CORYI|nr:hypothetical protein BT93_L1568 [Corymbia citriodora subsp. variegata]